MTAAAVSKSERGCQAPTSRSPATLIADCRYLDEERVRLPDDRVLDIDTAIARIRWIQAECPLMPHEYVVGGRADPEAIAAILTMIEQSPNAVRAYWRGYRSPTTYWHGPNGFRYWRSLGIRPELRQIILNRTDAPDDTRPVDEGAKPIPWEGAPWARSGSGIYERVPGLRDWWPTAEAIRGGFKPCRACKRPSAYWRTSELRVNPSP